MKNIYKAGAAVVTVGVLGYISYRVYNIVKQYNDDQKKTEVTEALDDVAKAYDKDLDSFNEDGGEMGEDGPTMHIVTTDADLQTPTMDAKPERWPYIIGGQEFNSEKELSIMRFESNSPEAMAQFKEYLLAQIQEPISSAYVTLKGFLDIPVEVDEVRDDWVIRQIREARVTFFGESAPEDILNGQTFGEVLIVLTNQVMFDWSHNDFGEVALELLKNVGFADIVKEYGADEAAQIVVDHQLTEVNVVNGRIGVFALPVQNLTQISNDQSYGFWDQYQESSFGEK